MIVLVALAQFVKEKQMTFDYKKILLAYINHVGECEGCTFLGRSVDNGITGLSSEEVEELRRLDSAANE
jgi:Fe-S cluster biogenesis protein NfuA